MLDIAIIEHFQMSTVTASTRDGCCTHAPAALALSAAIFEAVNTNLLVLVSQLPGGNDKGSIGGSFGGKTNAVRNSGCGIIWLASPKSGGSPAFDECA